jgi:DNA invertase Pin-like site-specific DNA recombinase
VWQTAIALYARKSVERENSISCETQLEYCRSSIKPEERGEPVLTFVDNGFSGGDLHRDAFQRMMQQVRQGTIRKVIVYKLDRISRSLSDFVNILQSFKEYRVEFVSSQEAFDTSSPYGEMLVKLLMVFAEFERASIISRVTQAYAHRSELGFYMGGRRPYGFQLVPTTLHNVQTKKLDPVPSEIAQVRYLFEVYARENVSLRRLQARLVAEGKQPTNGSAWTTAKLSTILKNPIYVKANAKIYDYYDRHGVRMITDVSLFTGEYGAQLYGQSKHDRDAPDWSDMKLVLLTHSGIVDADIWLACQRKLAKNRQITNSYSNATSWLAGKLICEKCGRTMTTVKGKPNKNGTVRRYFNCTGRSNQKVCTGPNVTIYAEDLEALVSDCIAQKLATLHAPQRAVDRGNAAELNALKLKQKAIEQQEQQLLDTMLSGGCNDALLAIANQKAMQLRQDRQALQDHMEALKSRSAEAAPTIDLAAAWQTANYDQKKSVAMLLLHKICIGEDGTVTIQWAL